MRIHPITRHGLLRPQPPACPRPHSRRLVTLAIETSCDDTSVAVVEKRTCPNTGRSAAILHYHRKVTANNTAFNGIHPLVSLESHQENLAMLADEALRSLPAKGIPDFVSVTRGPGMRSNLFTGLDTAKGLAVAWQKPLVGVHHMQAHALTPRLVAALQTYCDSAQRGEDLPLEPETTARPVNVVPEFPFLSVLVSGGHTLLIHSASLTNHGIMGSTTDIAVGECLDKIARVVLPPDHLQRAGNTMYGALLEQFAFPGVNVSVPPRSSVNRNEESSAPRSIDACTRNGSAAPGTATFLDMNTAAEYRSKYEARYAYQVPKNHEEAMKRNVSKWGWGLNQPLAKAAGGLKNKSLEMSFSGLTTAVERVVRYRLDRSTGRLTKIERSPGDISAEERVDLAQYAMRAAFEHLAGRVVLGLQQCPAMTVVVAGGVAANSYLRYILASTLCAHGYDHVKIAFPPPNLCCDNAAMIAWAGIEMYQHGHRDPLSIRAVRKWPLDQLLSPPLETTPSGTPPKSSS